MISQHRARTRSLSLTTAIAIAATTMLALGGAACSGSVTSSGAPATNVDADASSPTDAATVDVAAIPDADNGAPSTVYPAFHIAEPTVGAFNETAIVLASPHVQPIVFEGDPQQARITSFTKGFTGSNYWKQATSEYGVGDITASDPIVVPASDVSFTTATTLTDAQIQTFLITHLDGAHAGWSAPDANTIYTVFYGSNVTVTLDPFGQSCKGFGGYHQFLTAGAVQVPYAVIPRCTELATLQGENDVMTGATSHELVEAATDPFGTGYDSADYDHFYYDLQPLSEVGDMCAFESDAFYAPPELGFSVQRTWSNKLAALGGSPCAPALDTSTYFAAVPVFKNHVTMVFGQGIGNSVPVNGVKAPLGQSVTIDLDLISSAAMGPFSILVSDIPTTEGKPAELSFSLDRESGQNGEKLHLTIARVAAASQYGGTEFSILAYTDATHYHQWMGYATE
jgi:hypothetical protein